MKKKEILTKVRRFCDRCPLRCSEECVLYIIRNGQDPDPKRKMTQKQLEALMKSHKRRGIKDIEFLMENGCGQNGEEEL